MSDNNRISFNDVARDLGYTEEPRPGGAPGGAPGGEMPRSPGGIPQFSPEMSKQSALRMAKMWPKERALKLFDYFKDAAAAHKPIEFDGHPACWAMMALCDYLSGCELSLYLAPFQKSLVLAPFSVGEAPVQDQMCSFEVDEKEDDVKLTVILADGGNPDPFKMPLSNVVAPPIAPGKSIYVELVGAHYLFTFGLPWTYPDCKAMYMKMTDGYYCVMSNAIGISVGDTVENPFE